MSETVLFGRGKQLVRLPRRLWEGHLAEAPEHSRQRLAFMTAEHHRVRYFVVRHLPLAGTVLGPGYIAAALQISQSRVEEILTDLEQHLFFLWRDSAGAVAWAYPVTVERTPHDIRFSSGERLYGAWGEDALATPFVQGRLRENEGLTFDIQTECGHCQRPLRLRINGAMNYQLLDSAAEPLVFSPSIDWNQFREPNIIHAYWRNSLFFWSEEHARQYRAEHSQVDGIYLTLDQAAYEIPISQGALFNFSWKWITQTHLRPSLLFC